MAAKTKKSGLSLDPHQVVLRPLVTEKGTHLVEHHNQYVFQVHHLATKEDIKRAVSELFDVTVVRVHTQNRLGKVRRFRQKIGRTSGWKKAIVTLSDEDRITLF